MPDLVQRVDTQRVVLRCRRLGHRSVYLPLIYHGAFKDIYVYAMAVASINFFLFYVIKCGRGAAEIRVVLTRAMLASERLRHLSD